MNCRFPGEIIRKAEDLARKESVSTVVLPPPSMQSNLQPDTTLSSSAHPASNTVLNFFKSLEFPTIPVGLLRGLLPLPVILSLGVGTIASNVFVKEVVRLDDRPMIILTLIAALVVSYALNYRENRMVIAKVLLQVMVIFLSIHYLLDIFGIKVGLAPTLEINPALAVGSDEIDSIEAAAVVSDGPLTQPNADTAWYFSKKVWGCVLFVGLTVVAAVYYLKGFGPVSPDDMNSFTTAVSQGIDRVSSEQVSLGQTVAERVNSAAFRADLLNRTSEGMLSDIAAAGPATARTNDGSNTRFHPSA